MDPIDQLRERAPKNGDVAWALSRLLAGQANEDLKQESLIWAIIAASIGQGAATAHLQAKGFSYTIGVEDPLVLALMLADARASLDGGGFLVASVLLNSGQSKSAEPIPEVAASAARYWLWRSISIGAIAILSLAELIRDGRGGAVDPEIAFALFALALGELIDSAGGAPLGRLEIDALASRDLMRDRLAPNRVRFASDFAAKLAADHGLPAPFLMEGDQLLALLKHEISRRREIPATPSKSDVKIQPEAVSTEGRGPDRNSPVPSPARSGVDPIAAIIAILVSVGSYLFLESMDTRQFHLRRRTATFYRLLENIFGHDSLPFIISIVTGALAYILIHGRWDIRQK